MKKTFQKTIWRSISGSFGRFLAILLIIMLGVSFLVGLRLTHPVMISTAEKYLNDTEFFDLRLISTIGFDDGDVEAVSRVSHVSSAEGSYSADFVSFEDDVERVLSANAISEKINIPFLVAGKMPQAANECLLDADRFGNEEIGRTLHVDDWGTAEESPFAFDTYTVVGLARSPLFLSVERSTSALGDGSVDGGVYMLPEGFSSEYYTQLYIRSDGDFPLYSDEYDDFIETLSDAVEIAASESVQSRFVTLVSDAESEISDGERELNEKRTDGEQKLSDARKELDDAKAEIAEGKAELADFKTELSEAAQQLDDGAAKIQSDYTSWRSALNQGWEQYESGKAELEEGEAEYQDGLKQAQAGREALEEAKKQAADGEAQLKDAQAQWEAGQAELDKKAAELENAQAALQKGKDDYDSGKKSHDAGLAAWKQASSELASREKALNYEENHTALNQMIAALEAQLKIAPEEEKPALQSQLEGLRSQLKMLEDGKAQIEAAKLALQKQMATLEESAAQLEKAQQQIEASEKEFEEQKTAGEAALQEGQTTLDETKKTLDQKEAELAAGRTEIEKNEADLEAAEEELAKTRKILDDGWATLETSRQQLETFENGIESYEEGARQIEESEKDLDKGQKEYEDGELEYTESAEELETEVAKAEQELADARAELDDLKKPELYVFTRDTNTGYVSFEGDSQIVENISAVFPLFFFLIAALVCSTTMTRMVDDDRTEIGTLRALGYSRAAVISKYLVYAGSAAVIGAIIGYFLGGWLFPTVIWIAYGMLYSIPGYSAVWSPALLVISLIVSVACSAGAAYFACRREMAGTPADLIRPKMPEPGKRILLERITPLWSRLKFLRKVSLRNIFRFKKRMVMMLLGISGCTALVLTGFGIHDSVANIANFQYDDIQKYDISVTTKNTIDDTLFDRISADYGSRTQVFASALMASGDLSVEDGPIKSVYIVASDDPQFTQIVDLHFKGETVPMPGKGEILISEKLASLTGAKVGGTVKISVSDTESAEFRVSGLVENYVNNYAYLSGDSYDAAFEAGYKPKTLLMQVAEGEDEYALAADLVNDSDIAAASVTTDIRRTIDNMMKSLNYVVVLVIASAGALAFVVLFNLGNINISERVREIATLKVLGFHRSETGAYVFRESLLLTAMGIVIGLPLGVLLHAFVMSQVQVDMVSFKYTINPLSYIWTVIMVMLFSIVTDRILRTKIDRISMAESLKSVE